MKTTVIIPARYASTRLPAKPLLSQTGKPLIVHVLENIAKANGIDQVVVATDDKRIFNAVEAANAKAVMTRDDHTSGTDRLAEAAEVLGLGNNDIVVNVQGDEPDIPSAVIEKLISILTSTDAPMATLCTRLDSELASDPNKVKVVFDSQTPARALYFSRAAIPYDRDGDQSPQHYLHMGIYAYRVWFLKKFASLPPAKLEQIEKLEQLRAMENGHSIVIAVVEYDGNGIDTPEDYADFVEKMKNE